MQGATKLAMQHEGVRPKLFAALANYDRSQCAVPLHHEYRRSKYESDLKDWQVAFEGSLVVLTLDDLVAKFHFSDAAKLQSWLRKAAKQAKNWAGDRGRIWNTFAALRDAEENDKVVFVD